MIEIKEEFVGGDKWVRAVELGGDAAIVLWLAIRNYAAKHPMDGFVHASEVPRLIGRPRAWKRALKALIECGIPREDGTIGAGLLDVEEHGYRLHDYLDHATSREEEQERRSKQATTKALWRARKRAVAMGLDASTMSDEELLSLPKAGTQSATSATNAVDKASGVRGQSTDVSEDRSALDNGQTKDMSPRAHDRVHARTGARANPTQPNPLEDRTAAAARARGEPPRPRLDSFSGKIPICEWRPLEAHSAYATELGLSETEYTECLSELADKRSQATPSRFDGLLNSFIEAKADRKQRRLSRSSPRSSAVPKRQPDDPNFDVTKWDWEPPEANGAAEQ